MFGQKAKDDKSCQQQVKITRTLSQAPIANGAVAGTILDPNGAVIAGAGITLSDVKSKRVHEVKSADDGRFFLSNIAPGVYQLVVTTPNFQNLLLPDLSVAGKETVNVEAILLLKLPDKEILVGVIAYEPMIDESSSHIKTTFSEKMIRSLPIP